MEVIIFSVKKLELPKLTTYLIIKELDSLQLSTKLILGIMNGFSLKLMEPKFGKDNLPSKQVVSTYVVAKMLIGMNKSSKLTKSSITIQRKLEFLSQPLLTKMLTTNHGDSENSNFSMKLNKNALSSIPNVTLKVLNSDSVVDHQTSEKTVFHPPLDLSRSLLKEELPFMRRMISKVKRLFTLKVLNVLKIMICK